MKRTLWIILALALLFTLCCGAAVADGDVTTYDIRLGYTAVTSENKDDILGDGTARFLPESGTLVLDGAAVAGAHEEYYQIRYEKHPMM